MLAIKSTVTVVCDVCTEEVYIAQLARHQMKDHEEDEYARKIDLAQAITKEYGLGIDTIMSLVEPI